MKDAALVEASMPTLSRYENRKQYFDEQYAVTQEYVIPYINQTFQIEAGMSVAEIGCGEAGNLLPFLNLGCKVVGVDIRANKIQNARAFYADHPQREKVTLIADDVFNINSSRVGRFDLIVVRDTLEHIDDQSKFVEHIKSLLKQNGKIFFGFPPWRMPFGGHQQICANKSVRYIPYLHLLPKMLFISILKLFGESNDTIIELLSIRSTRISIFKFRKIIRNNNLRIDNEQFYVINPNYRIKFNMAPCKLPWALNVPWIRDSFITTCYYVIGNK